MDHEQFTSGAPTPLPPEDSDDDRVTILDQFDDEAPDSEEDRLAYLKSVVPPEKEKSKWPLVLVLIVIALVLLAGGSYAVITFDSHRAAHQLSSSKSATTKSSTAGAPAKSNHSSASNAPSNQYVSNGQDLNFTLTLPAGWSPSPVSNDNANDQPITITSPIVSISDANGTSSSGKVVISFRPVGSQMSELATGSATAAVASSQFDYSQPSSDQFEYPYLTFMNLSGGVNTSGAFQEVLITGTTAYAPGESITASDIAVDPIITASFYRCFTTECTGTGQIQMGITSATWQSNQVFVQTLGIFKSLQMH